MDRWTVGHDGENGQEGVVGKQGQVGQVKQVEAGGREDRNRLPEHECCPWEAS